MHIVPIVEGHGEVEAVPILIRRISRSLRKPEPEVAHPIRCPRNKISQPDELERIIQLACLKLRLPGAILILMDADTDCPARLGPKLLSEVKNIRRNLLISVVFAKHEYEAWFIAAISSLRGKRGIGKTVDSPNDPESIRGAKEFMEKQMEKDRNYSETVDQPALTDLFDLNEARQKSSSFDKFYREIERILSSK